MAPALVRHGPHRGTPKSRGEQPVVARRHSAALKVTEHEGAGLLAGNLLNLIGHAASDAAYAPVLTWQRRTDRGLRSALRSRALRHDYDRKMSASSIPRLNLLADLGELI